MKTELLRALNPSFMNPIKINDTTGTQTLGDRAIVYVIALEDGHVLYTNKLKSDGSFFAQVMPERELAKYQLDESHLKKVRVSVTINSLTFDDQPSDVVVRPVELTGYGLLNPDNTILRLELRN